VSGREHAEAVAIFRALADGSAKARRKAAGVTQAEMAAVLHVWQSAVSQWETGKRTPDVKSALAYGRVLADAERRAA
jgi:transcriptional regulator with XRE-family HTH domain